MYYHEIENSINRLEKDIGHLEKIERLLREIKMDTSALKAAFTQVNIDVASLTTAFGTFSTDVTNKLNQLIAGSDSPVDIQNVADITAGLGTMDTAIQGIAKSVSQLDASLNPPAPTPVTPPVTPTPSA